MNLNNIDLNKVAVFCQVVESGNYQRASEALHVTPSALSQTITGLEFALGFALFERRGRRLVPTGSGHKIHREFRQSQASFLGALRELRGPSRDVNGLLRLGAYLEFAKSRLSGVVTEFTRAHREASLKMIFDSPSRLHNLLDQGQLDLCCSIFPAREKKAVLSTALSEEELVLIAPPGLLPESPRLEQILAAPVVDYFFNHQPIRRWISLHYGKAPKKIPVRIFAATAEMVAALVREGAGLGVVPSYLVATSDSLKGLRIVRPTGKRLVDYIWLLEKRSGEKSAAHLAFREQLLRHFDCNPAGAKL